MIKPINKKSEKKQLGIFWGDATLFFIETTATIPTKIFSVPLDPINQMSLGEKSLIAGKMQFVSLLQETLHKQNISINTVNLSLPAKDIIFRSFVIPWMQSNEIKDVVNFEAGKYIPFSLNELSFSYYPLSFNEQGTRKIRIIFVAIKTDALQQYTNILEQSALTVETVEPAPLSLIRALNLKNYFPEGQTVAIIEKEKDAGKIIIVDHGIPQFVREFRLKSAASNQEEIDPKSLMTRLINEIRISLDYFNRQDNQLEVKQILFLTSDNTEEQSKKLQESLNMPLIAINAANVLGNNNIKEIDFLNAYGASLTSASSQQEYFNLSKKTSANKISSSHSIQKTGINYTPVLITTLICLPIFVLTYLFSSKLIINPGKELASKKEQLGASVDIDPKTVQEKITTLNDKLTNFKNIRVKSKISLFLSTIPTLLPKGTWISQFDLYYTMPASSAKGKEAKDAIAEENKTKLNIELAGYAYHENIAEQFTLVNTFQANLKSNKDISETFKDVQVESIMAQPMGDHQVTYFKIRCQ